jgi:hypothetical protein
MASETGAHALGIAVAMGESGHAVEFSADEDLQRSGQLATGAPN